MVVVNPVPVALAHYEAELVAVLSSCGFDVSVLRTQNEGLGAFGRLRAAIGHALRLRRIARGRDTTIVIWPLLGWLDVLLLSTERRDKYIVVHDPQPLRARDVTLDARLGRLVGLVTPDIPTLIAHSSTATQEITAILGEIRLVTVPHPVLPASPRTQSINPAPDERIRIGVFGQYKTARDLALLTRLAGAFPDPSWTGTVKGRNWPSVDGWHVESRFLSEDELAASIDSVDVVLIPYDRYYQSGIALRAVESGIPVVGRRNAFLEEFLGSDYVGLVDDDTDAAWIEAVKRVTSRGTPIPSPFPAVARAWARALEGETSAWSGAAS